MTPDKERDLKPCPFCGGSNVRQQDDPRGDPMVKCYTCGGAMVYGNRPQDAIDAWQARVPLGGAGGDGNALKLLDAIERALEGYDVEHERVSEGNDAPGYALRVWGSDRANLAAALKSHVPLLREKLHQSPDRAALREVRGVIAFYATPDNWKWTAKPTDMAHILDCGSEVQRDFGEKARAALATINQLLGEGK